MFFQMVAAVVIRSARTTSPAAIGLGKCVALIERMALYARSLSGILGGQADPSENVHSGRDWLQVRRVNACPVRTCSPSGALAVVVAQMVEHQPLGDRADTEFVGPSVGSKGCFGAASLNHDYPIPEFRDDSSPEPARIGELDLRPKPLFEWKVVAPVGDKLRQRIAVCPPSLVVRHAPAPGQRRASAIFNRANLRGRLIKHLEPILRGVIGPDVSASRPFSIVSNAGGVAS